jgi:hypothetical protein
MIEKTYYKEAMRYLDNAKDSLLKAGIDGMFYKDEKYVKQAAGTAYAGIELSARWYLQLKGYKEPLTDKKEITKGLSKFNKKAMDLFHECYEILHKDAYYGDIKGIDTIKSGMKYAKEFILLLEPYKNLLESEDAPKRRFLHRNR